MIRTRAATRLSGLQTIALSACLSIIGPTLASADTLKDDGCLPVRQIEFKAGRTSTVLSDVLVRTGLRCYQFSARAGQILTADLSAPDDNVDFSIYKPGFDFKKVQDDLTTIGQPLAGAGNDDNARHIRSVLPDTGTYLVILALERGGAGSFKMRVAIRR